ncbi:asparagine synthetase B family protein [Streptomyces sp. SCA3-4]|uniref:asparagine synthase-related protein n=1 Tax=Streptomyces sichuanensis TaxID=2871810 RepID=UPI001CE394C3|nr:asparagine synthase-related protein [Streptomyces sichuanensis]MCA6093898.1 asparagine synthetase B family protein [Streptomyces sichuanensis]
MPSHGTPFFFAFSDSEAGCAVARHLCRETAGLRIIEYDSGRPWIVGLWDDDGIAVARAGNKAVVLIGTLPKLGNGLGSRVERLRDLSELDGLSSSVPGEFHLLATLGGAMRVQGTAYGTRRVFHTRTEGTEVVADRAALLAELIDAPLDLTAVAMRLVQPVIAPLDRRVMWQGVSAVQPGWQLTLQHDGRARHLRWHRPPEPHLALTAGAAAVRSAMADAVGARTHLGGLISADLSGGMDSTSICALAARDGAAKLIACSATGEESENQDGYYARLAAEQMPGTEHFVLPKGELPLFYSGVVDERSRTDAPSIFAISRDRATVLNARMAERGSRLHLTGYGGDHLFLGSPVHYHGLLPHRPLLSLQRIRAFRIIRSWPWREVIPQLADRRSFRSALAGLSAHRSGSLSLTTPALGWAPQPHVPVWLTRDSRDVIQREFTEVARDAVPYAATTGRHNELAVIYGGTQDMRAMAEISRHAGVPVATPYFDDQVVDAALSVRIEDRVTPWEYKPLLAAAMRGVVPDTCLSRTTKGDGTPDEVGGLYRHRDELAALWEDSALAALGLVDQEALRRSCTRPGSPEMKDGAIGAVLACEVWLRTAHNGHSRRTIS